MLFDELSSQLLSRNHRKEMEEIRALVQRETNGLKGSRQQINRAHTEMSIALLVSRYMDGTAETEDTPKHHLAKKIAGVLLEDVKRDTNKRLLAVAVPSPDRLVDRPERGSRQPDLGPALAKLETYLQKEGGIVRLVGDRDSFTAIYREIGVTSSSLGGALADLVGKMQRERG